MNTKLRQPATKNLLYIGEKNREQQEVKDHLELENYTVHHVTKINDALVNLKKDRMEVILMDTSRNEIACLELCHVLKSNSRQEKKVVIIASGNGDESSEVAAFRAGADDYIARPLKPAALVERIKARMNEPKERITIHPESGDRGTLYIDKNSYTVFSDNSELKLSRKEFELLYLLASQPGKIFRREEVFEKVWKKKFENANRTVDVHILRLRKKLGEQYIQTQKGVGYRFTK